jgi:predicted metal-dependent phosphoesterase TrpH
MNSSLENQRIDMHTHSNYSDGVHAPAALIDMAKSKGLAGLALTDHDSMEGYPELKAAAAIAGLEVITGCELSCESPEGSARAGLRR